MGLRGARRLAGRVASVIYVSLLSPNAASCIRTFFFVRLRNYFRLLSRDASGKSTRKLTGDDSKEF